MSRCPPDLAEAVQMMPLGGRMLVIVPPELSFGDTEWPKEITRGTPLRFDLELVDILTQGSN